MTAPETPADSQGSRQEPLTLEGSTGGDTVDVTLRISRELERRLRGYLHYTGTVTLCLNGEDPAVLGIWLDPPVVGRVDL